MTSLAEFLESGYTPGDILAQAPRAPARETEWMLGPNMFGPPKEPEREINRKLPGPWLEGGQDRPGLPWRGVGDTLAGSYGMGRTGAEAVRSGDPAAIAEAAVIAAMGGALPGAKRVGRSIEKSVEASRATRRAEMGIPDTTWYRGRALPVPESFTPGRGGRHFGDDADALFFSSSPKTASAYAKAHAFNNEMKRIYDVRDAAEKAYYERPLTFLEKWWTGRPHYKGPTIEGDWLEGANVFAANIHPGRQAVVDVQAKGGTANFDIRQELKRLKAEGYDTVLVRNSDDALGMPLGHKGPFPDELVVFPKNGEYRGIRSKYSAAFDPAKSDSPNLLAGLAGPAIMAPAVASGLAALLNPPHDELQ